MRVSRSRSCDCLRRLRLTHAGLAAVWADQQRCRGSDAPACGAMRSLLGPVCAAAARSTPIYFRRTRMCAGYCPKKSHGRAAPRAGTRSVAANPADGAASGPLGAGPARGRATVWRAGACRCPSPIIDPTRVGAYGNSCGAPDFRSRTVEKTKSTRGPQPGESTVGSETRRCFFGKGVFVFSF